MDLLYNKVGIQMKVWLQLHDFSTIDITDCSISSALKVVLEFNWNSELQKEEQAMASKTENCPPGIGLICDSGRILHIMPRRKNLSDYYYEYPLKKRVFGFIPVTSQISISAPEISNSLRQEIIQCHYDKNHYQLVELLQLNRQVL